MNKTISGYSVGALLYCPANMHSTIVESLQSQRLPRPFSLAFCLEDTIPEDAVPAAEKELRQTLAQLAAAAEAKSFYLPLIFIRIRSPQQLLRLAADFAPYAHLLAGFILPKFFIENCAAYIAAIQHIREALGLGYFYMPIFEAASMIELPRRHERLAQIKDQLEPVREQILNIRVGGNDLCQAFGLRRHVNNTIYQIRPVAQLLTDILTTFATSYVVSGPVWEYYAGRGWEAGLRQELEEDLLCGFIGKTVIHPNQIAVVNQCLQVSAADYQDACQILNWDAASTHLVSPSAGADRMNEYKTHSNWARRTIQLAQIYGVRP